MYSPSQRRYSVSRRFHASVALKAALDLEWKLIYVSSPDKEELDQELDDCLVGPVPLGVNSFEFEGSPPDPSKIPPEDVLGVAALILTGSYRDQEFVRVGYYQNTEYDSEEMRETPPQKILFERLERNINAKPRVTRFQIKWCVPLYNSSSLQLITQCGYPSSKGCRSTTRGSGRCWGCEFCPSPIRQ